jgi:hypothetical protein
MIGFVLGFLAGGGCVAGIVYLAMKVATYGHRDPKSAPRPVSAG